ncbi:MAG: hypothetical protein IPQ07_04255 [Myxococcales bacterium]|nr:hypothetical protein [Myxococcales bacterium]
MTPPIGPAPFAIVSRSVSTSTRSVVATVRLKLTLCALSAQASTFVVTGQPHDVSTETSAIEPSPPATQRSPFASAHMWSLLQVSPLGHAWSLHA